ncbi:Hypothetical predicted protein [Mytilus galloprovincialis]|uniref:Reverse transcriptase domain-containing protein n=1 Tax=Mytilus galloprovincialis TaxID=29158 RepID=A0A8B6GFS4_MYTGA|nr:Hypothetical predicted protein [Mytilus galloprovincialis]
MEAKMKAVRAGHKGAVTKLLRKFEEIQQSSEADYEEISTLLEAVTQKKRILENINEKILEQTSDEDVAGEIQDSDEYMYNLEYKLRQITKLAKSVQNQSLPANESISLNLNPHADNFIPNTQSVPSTFISQPSTSANQQYTHSSNSRSSSSTNSDNTNTELEEFQTIYENSSVSFLDNKYVAKLPWKTNHPPLPSNKAVAFRRTENVIRRLSKEPQLLQKYGEIIEEQEKRGFIEKVEEDLVKPNTKLHYIPHHAVKKDSATTPIRIVYDCSCRQTPDTASLINDCLLNVPPKLNDVTAILLRFRMNKYAVCTDIEKAFLNVGLDIEDRDVTRFFWLSNPTDPSSCITTYRFKSVLFGATCSPFILNAVLSKHINNHQTEFTDNLMRDLYVDNIVSWF